MEDSSARNQPMLETTKGMREIIFAQTRLIDHCLHLLVLHRDGEAMLPRGDAAVFPVVRTMVHMVGISGHSILKLTEDVGLGVRDTFPIARGIVEGVVNICLILAEGRESAERAARHAEVKAYLDLNRDWIVGELEMSVSSSLKPSDEVNSRLEAMVSEFTSKKGREKNWTDLTVKQRLAAVSERFPDSALISLNASTFNIYRHASEILHGSYFSAVYFWGLTRPGTGTPENADQFSLTLMDHQFSVLSSVIMAYAGLLECFADYVDVPQLNSASERLLEQFKKLPAIAETLATESGRSTETNFED